MPTDGFSIKPLKVKLSAGGRKQPSKGVRPSVHESGKNKPEKQMLFSSSRTLAQEEQKQDFKDLCSQRLPIDLGPSNNLVFRPPTTSRVSNGGVGSSIESPRSLWVV